jgi:hypothetical protein
VVAHDGAVLAHRSPKSRLAARVRDIEPGAHDGHGLADPVVSAHDRGMGGTVDAFGEARHDGHSGR